MLKTIKAFFGGDDGGGSGKRPSSFKSSSTTTVSSSSGSGRFGSNRSLSSSGGSSRTLGSNGNSSGTGSSGNGSGNDRRPSLNAAAFANDGGGDGHEGRRALSMNIKRHHNLVKQTPERLDGTFLNVILDQLRGGTEDVDDGMTRVPLEERNQAARRGSAASSASALSSEFRPVAVGLTGGLPSTTVGRIAPIDGASQFGGSTANSSTARESTDRSVSTFGGLSFAPSFAPNMRIPDTIEEGHESSHEERSSAAQPPSQSSQQSQDPPSSRPMGAPEWSAWNDESQRFSKKNPSKEPYYYRGTPLNSTFLSRLLLIILCFCLSLIFTIVLGGGRLGNDAATFMYKSTVVEDGSIGVWLPPSAGGTSSSPGTETSWHPEGGDFPDLAAMNIELPLPIERNYADNTVSYAKGTRDDLPIYWQIPRSGGTLVRKIFGNCLHLVQASQLGAAAERNNEVDLRTYQTTTGVHFVNVDTTTPSGIQRAKELDLASSATIDVAFTPLIYPMAEACNPRHQGRPFALFSHPIEREVRIFYYEKANSAALAEMSLLDYVQSGRISNNWMTRFLTNKFTGTLTVDDLHVAMEILRRKFVIGLEEKMKESILRFERYFGWGLHATQEMGRCQDDELLAHGTDQDDENIPKGSAEWYLIMAQNEYDLQLYDYARYLYDVQGGGIAR